MRATTLSQAPAGQPNFMPPAMQMMQMITGCWVSQSIYGKNVFAYYAENPEPAAVFDRAMASFSSIETAAVVNEFDFSGIEILVDVAGGQGGLLLTIPLLLLLHRHPQLGLCRIDSEIQTVFASRK